MAEAGVYCSFYYVSSSNDPQFLLAINVSWCFIFWNRLSLVNFFLNKTEKNERKKVKTVYRLLSELFDDDALYS